MTGCHRLAMIRLIRSGETLMWDYISIAGVAVACLVGVLITALRLPGTWLIVLAAGVSGWLSDWRLISIITLVVLAVIALLAEIIEMFGSALLARRAGGTRNATWGALVGGFTGMFLFSIPLPVIGTTIGAILGCFLGALIGELAAQRHLVQGTRVGFFSALGFVLGVVFKIAIAFLLAGIVLSLLFTSVVCN